MIPRVLLIIALVPLLLFCGFGFLASGELSGPSATIWRSVYATLVVLFMGGIYWAATGLFATEH